jgi:hypothetical protein
VTPGRPPRSLAAAAVAVGSVALLLAPAAGATAAAPSAAPATPVAAITSGAEIFLTSVTPAAVTPQTELVVTGRVRNAGTSALPPMRVGLRLRGARLEDREAVRTWTTRGTVAEGDRRLPGAANVGGLQPGASAPFRITVPAGDLDLPAAGSAFGPRGIAIEATTGAGRTRVGLARTTIVWYGIKEFHPTRLTLVAPVTAPAGADPTTPSPQLAAAFAPGGSLTRTLEATRDPLIAWALDPALLDAARSVASPAPDGGTGATPSASPSPSASGGTTPEEQQGAGAWLGTARSGIEGRSVVTLPYGDPDLVALDRAKAGALLRTADGLARTTTQETLGTALAPQIAWPAGGAIDAGTLATMRTSGRSAVILGSGTQPLAEPQKYTSTGRSTVQAGGGPLDGLLYDEQLSTLFGATGGPRGAAATQQLVAELAAITLERTGDPRHVLAVVPRGWDPDPRGVEAAMTALRTTPWITLRTLSDLRETAPPADHVAPRYAPRAVAAELPGAHVAAVAAMFDDTSRFAPALVDPDPVVDPILRRCLMLVSAAWRPDRAGLDAARAPVARQVNNLVGGVHIVRGTSRPYFLASEAALPVSVANGTPYPVRVVVSLRPRSGSLVIEKPVAVDLAPNTRRQQVLVPTKALASGDVQIVASVRTPDGQLIGTERELVVRVRREWETRGIIGAGTLLGVLLAVGLLRGVRRDRTRVRPEDVPDVDDLASAAGDRAAARRDALEEEAALDEGEGEPPPQVVTDGDRNASEGAPDELGQSGRAVASPDSAAGGERDARDRPVMSREHR